MTAATKTHGERVEVHAYKYRGRKQHERWTFVHVAGNGRRQASRERYVTAWGARRAARKLYPGLPVEMV